MWEHPEHACPAGRGTALCSTFSRTDFAIREPIWGLEGILFISLLRRLEPRLSAQAHKALSKDVITRRSPPAPAPLSPGCVGALDPDAAGKKPPRVTTAGQGGAVCAEQRGGRLTPEEGCDNCTADTPQNSYSSFFSSPLLFFFPCEPGFRAHSI